MRVCLRAGGRTQGSFTFTPANFRAPDLPSGLDILEVQLIVVQADSDLEGFGKLVHAEHEISVDNGNFEIVAWPTTGWRKLDPHTGDEAGTTEVHVFCSHFRVCIFNVSKSEILYSNIRMRSCI